MMVRARAMLDLVTHWRIFCTGGASVASSSVRAGFGHLSMLLCQHRCRYYVGNR